MCFICVSRNLLVCYRVRGCVYDQYYVSSCMCQQMHNALLRCPSRTFAMNMALKKICPKKSDADGQDWYDYFWSGFCVYCNRCQ